MPQLARASRLVASVFVAAVVSVGASGAGQDPSAGAGVQREGNDRKPSLSLKVTPPVGFSPLRVRVLAELRGGPNDYPDFYCPAIEWDWGDGTVSESSEDCNPYEAGKSEIRRRFAADHLYRQSDSYRLSFRIKQKSKVVATSAVSVQVRPGMREELGQE